VEAIDLSRLHGSDTTLQPKVLKTHVIIITVACLLLRHAVQARQLEQQELEAEQAEMEMETLTALAQQREKYEKVSKWAKIS
jgi:hypothetical protein